MGRSIRYPTGVRPLLMEEAARRKRIEARLTGLLEEAGFAEVILPVLDYVDAYRQVQSAPGKDSYRFVDREGELVALRSDFTPMVARSLAPALRPEILPLRVFYRGDVIRCDRSRLGAGREMFQIGAELIGDASPEADLEMLRLAAALAGQQATIIYSSEEGLDSLLDARFVRQPAELEEPGYYTGMRFSIYGPSRRTIAQGGRYDQLYERFGAPAPAVGFTFTVDELD